MRGWAGALLSTATVWSGVQPTLPAKSVTQWWMLWRPSLKWVVSIEAPPETPSSQGRIRVPRHSPPMLAFAQPYSVRSTRAPSRNVSPKRMPLPVSAPQKLTPWAPRRQPPAVMSPPIPAAGPASSSTVIVNARSADQEPGSRLHHLLSPRAQSSRSSIAAIGEEKPATNSRGVMSVVAAPAKTLKLPPPSTAPIRCSMPSWRTCHQVPRIWVMPVPGGAFQRQRPKRVPETVGCPSLVKLFRWTPSKGSAPAGGTHQASCRNFAPPVVSAQSASAPTYQPHWATAYLPAFASPAARSSRATASPIPIPTIRP